MATALGVTPLSQDCSDAELVAAVRRGSDTAFEELYSRYSRRIGAYVRGMVADHGRAEDVTQEIFIAALRRMRDTDRPITFKPWIYEIAKNACIDSFRRTRRAQEVSLDADDGLSSADRGRLTVVTTPDAALDSKQALHDLRGAFGGLSDSHHEILVMRELEGRSYSDIGERLGMSRAVVESTLFRARRRLAEEYDELASGRRCEFVRKMVDSGPHYSLGLRDRRRMARHFAHCQPCRAHAHAAGFDDSILNMPSVAAKIAALLPIPLLHARWDAVDRLGAERGRPSWLALRSVHTLAGSSDQIFGASSGAGRGAAAAAAIMLAGVGGGIVTATSSPSSPRTEIHAYAYRAGAAAPVQRTALRGAKALTVTAKAARVSSASAHAASSRVRYRAVAPAGSSHAALKVVVPRGASTPTSASAPPSAPPSTVRAGAPAAARPGGSGDGKSAGGSAPPNTSTGSGGSPAGTGTGTPPTAVLSTGSLSTTLRGVVSSLPLPTVPGAITGSTPAGTVAGTVNGVLTGLGQLLGHS